MVNKQCIKWMLRVSYDMGPNFCDSGRIRNKEFRSYVSKHHAFIVKDELLADGFMEHKADTELCYEWWVAPSQILGMAIIEYEEEQQ